ncbi:acetyltransferase [Psychrobacillus sp. NPDC058041]|uniref:acetyltransferase n=1 Tax=Psychrobacillus sp. NPDC058041 TaxID=3346310 RepID=UPI0036DF1D20
MLNKPIILIGNGGHASVLTEILLTQNRTILGYTAPSQESNTFGLQYIGPDMAIQNYNPNEIELILGIGTVNVSNIRKSLFERMKQLGFQFAKVIHGQTILSPSVTLGEGVQIMAGAIIQTNVKVGNNTIINTGACIDHDSNIGEHVHIAPRVTISGGVKIKNGCHVGTGATLIQGITLGNDSLIGAGAVVIHNIAAGKKAIGVPAKEV